MKNQALSLLELNGLIRENLEFHFPESLWVVAEIHDISQKRNSHCYLELIQKDREGDSIIARSRAIIWAGVYKFLAPFFHAETGQELAAGMKIMLLARVAFHEAYGLSLHIQDLDPRYTLGDMAKKRAETIRKLKEDGVFHMNQDLPLGDLLQRIAVISSKEAAGFGDFADQLLRNPRGFRFFPRLFEATMQGSQAAESIKLALDRIFRSSKIWDCVVLIRGGGSRSDLACFDQYDLASHIAQFPIPVITGIGHDRDESVADLVAHTALKTPTAVAEFLIHLADSTASQLHELEERLAASTRATTARNSQQLDLQSKRFTSCIGSRLISHNQVLTFLTTKLLFSTRQRVNRSAGQLSYLAQSLTHSGKTLLMAASQTQHHHEAQLVQSARTRLSSARHGLNFLEKTIGLLNPEVILRRGYSLTYHKGAVVKSMNDVPPGGLLQTRVQDGIIISTVEKTERFPGD